jgi:hypothetical protein
MIHRKTVAALALATLTAGGALMASAQEADARWRGRGAAVAAGVVGGLALGAIAASAAPRYNYGYYSDPYYGGPYYGPSYGYGYDYGYAPTYGSTYVYSSPSYAYDTPVYGEPVVTTYAAPSYAYGPRYVYGPRDRGGYFGSSALSTRLDDEAPSR